MDNFFAGGLTTKAHRAQQEQTGTDEIANDIKIELEKLTEEVRQFRHRSQYRRLYKSRKRYACSGACIKWCRKINARIRGKWSTLHVV